MVVVVLMFLSQSKPPPENEGIASMAINPPPSTSTSCMNEGEIRSGGGGGGQLKMLLPKASSVSIKLAPIVSIPRDIDLLPVGSGVMNILRFYYGDIYRLAKLLLTIDFVRTFIMKHEISI